MIVTKRLLELVAEMAAEERKNSIPEGAMRVGPGSDAVVWLVCPDYKAEL